MSRLISKHPLRIDGEEQAVSIQRRSRILTVAAGAKSPELFVETHQDDATRAVDVAHSRRFVCLKAGATAPDGSTYIDSCTGEWAESSSGRGPRTTYLVYELPGVKPTGL